MFRILFSDIRKPALDLLLGANEDDDEEDKVTNDDDDYNNNNTNAFILNILCLM